MDTNAVYCNYMRLNCGPETAVDKAVESVESTLRECLVREGLGLPFEDVITVKALYEALLSNQGRFVEGDLLACVGAIATDISQMKIRTTERTMQKYNTNLFLRQILSSHTNSHSVHAPVTAW